MQRQFESPDIKSSDTDTVEVTFTANEFKNKSNIKKTVQIYNFSFEFGIVEVLCVDGIKHFWGKLSMVDGSKLVKNRVFLASCKITILCTNNETPSEAYIGLFLYTSKSHSAKVVPFIRSTKLLDPNTFKVKITLSQIKDVSKNEWLRLDTTEKCCDNVLRGKFRLTINRLFDHILGICSTEFKICNVPWRFICICINENRMNLTIEVLDFGMHCFTSV